MKDGRWHARESGGGLGRQAQTFLDPAAYDDGLYAPLPTFLREGDRIYVPGGV